MGRRRLLFFDNEDYNFLPLDPRVECIKVPGCAEGKEASQQA